MTVTTFLTLAIKGDLVVSRRNCLAARSSYTYDATDLDHFWSRSHCLAAKWVV